MPPISTYSAVVNGLTASLIEIEVSFTRGFAGLQLLGNPSDVCREGKERAKTALECLGLRFPAKRIMLSLNPSDIYKAGSQIDLAMAVALESLLSEKSPAISLKDWLFVAELGLTGGLKPTRALTSFILLAIEKGFKGLVLARENAAECDMMLQQGLFAQNQLEIVTAGHLRDLITWIYNGERPVPHTTAVINIASTAPKTFADMLLSPQQRLLAQTIAVGFHSCLLNGPPGVGKTMFAERLASLLPPLAPAEKIRSLKLHGLASQQLSPSLLIGQRPFRSPHHSASLAALVGSGSQPGELSLATAGILFLDELTEFRRDFLEALREPLQSGSIEISRADHKVRWDASVLLVAATNNCPCGNWGSRKKECPCSTTQLAHFRRKLSGPLLDRIDLHVNFPEHDDASTWLQERSKGLACFQELLQRIEQARAFAAERNATFQVMWNRDLPTLDLAAALAVDAPTFSGYVNYLQQLSSSRRSVFKLLRVARTLADLELKDRVSEVHIHQAGSWLAETAAKQRGEIN